VFLNKLSQFAILELKEKAFYLRNNGRIDVAIRDIVEMAIMIFQINLCFLERFIIFFRHAEFISASSEDS